MSEKANVFSSQHKDAEGHYRIGLGLTANHRHVQHRDGNSAESLCIKEHNSLTSQFLQDCGDEVPTTQNNQTAHVSGDLTLSRNEHKDPLGVSMLEQLHSLEKSFLDPPPNCYWVYNEDGWLILRKKMNQGNIDCRINVCPHYTGVFAIIIGEQEVVYIPTLRQAISIAEKIAYAFRDKLPAQLWHDVKDKSMSQHKPTRTVISAVWCVIT